MEEDYPNEDSNEMQSQPKETPVSENTQIKLLKQQLKDRDEKIDQLENHVLALKTETGPQHGKTKRRLENDGDKQVNDRKTKEEEILRRHRKTET